MVLPTAETALPGRDQPVKTSLYHHVLQTPLQPPFAHPSKKILFGMGCFWGAEKAFWSLPGVLTTAVGYSGGFTPNPNYQEVCTGRTGHNEVVLVVYRPSLCFETLLKVFWESHVPTQGMRQGNDLGTQYRSGIYCYTEQQRDSAMAGLAKYQSRLDCRRRGDRITTEIVAAGEFYYAEDDHQQYLAKNPNGYCGLGGMGIEYPIDRSPT